MAKIGAFLLMLFLSSYDCYMFGYKVDKTKCPTVKAMRNFDLNQLLGRWYVIQYYASSEEDLSYKCMRAEFTQDDKILSTDQHQIEVTMNFTYAFINDPLSELLLGNITWQMPDSVTPAHWVHAEDTYEGIYNTYVLDTDYSSWTLLMHCAEKEKSTRYLSSFIMSRNNSLPFNVISYLRDKLPRYGIDLSFMFDMLQDSVSCDNNGLDFVQSGIGNSMEVQTPVPTKESSRKRSGRRRHPLKRGKKSSSEESS